MNSQGIKTIRDKWNDIIWAKQTSMKNIFNFSGKETQ